MVKKTVKVLADIGGVTIKGWRCPDYRVSPQTLDILSSEGFAWDSSLLNDDLPCLFDCEGGKLIELPFTTSTADKTYVGYRRTLSRERTCPALHDPVDPDLGDRAAGQPARAATVRRARDRKE
jgi:hypothetical protein